MCSPKYKNQKQKDIVQDYINMQNKKKPTTLSEAVFNGDTVTVKSLLKASADVNMLDSDGNTTLIDAAARGYDKIVRLLLAAGADINIQNKNGETALIQAMLNKDKDNNANVIVELLLKAGANVNIRDKDGKTALEHAKTLESDNRKIIINLLLAARVHEQ